MTEIIGAFTLCIAIDNGLFQVIDDDTNDAEVIHLTHAGHMR